VRPTAGHHTERRQLVDDEIGDLVGAQRPAEVAADQVRDGAGSPAAVDTAGDEVQQLGQLDHLPVGAPDEGGRLGEAAVLQLAE